MLSNMSHEARENLSGAIGVGVGLICTVVAFVIYMNVSGNSDDPLSWSHFILGFALPLVAMGALLIVPTIWVSNRILHPRSKKGNS